MQLGDIHVLHNTLILIGPKIIVKKEVMRLLQLLYE